MPRPAEDLQKHTMNFYAGDFDRIRALWPDQEPSVIIREAIHAMVVNHEAVATSEPPRIEIVVGRPQP